MSELYVYQGDDDPFDAPGPGWYHINDMEDVYPTAESAISNYLDEHDIGPDDAFEDLCPIIVERLRPQVVTDEWIAEQADDAVSVLVGQFDEDFVCSSEPDRANYAEEVLARLHVALVTLVGQTVRDNRHLLNRSVLQATAGPQRTFSFEEVQEMFRPVH